MDVRQHSRHLSEGSEKFLDVPPQSGLFHRIRHLGISRTKTSIWARVRLLSVPVRHHHRCLLAIPLLAMATVASKVQGQIYQHPDRLERRRVYSSCHWYQLLFVVCCRVHFPVLDQTEELLVVVKVQLCHQCGTGLWYVYSLI